MFLVYAVGLSFLIAISLFGFVFAVDAISLKLPLLDFELDYNTSFILSIIILALAMTFIFHVG